ncbi:MAG: SPFH domain-containing protein, partial [Bacteroidia bacterium]|nr:SPFH domain-containing protein [Bacteroidia bacterium]
DLFRSGRYTLETQNIPLLKKAMNRATGDETPFHCEVYFINKTEQMGINWGTDSKVLYTDPVYDYPFAVGASGQMSLKVADSRKLLLKLVGTASSLSQTTLVSYFRAPMMTKIKAYLPNVLSDKQISILDIDKHMDVFSEDLHEKLAADFSEYGIEITNFWINAFVKPENDPNYRKLFEIRAGGITIAGDRLQQQRDLIQQETKMRKQEMEAETKAKARAVQGYTYQQERAYDVAERIASNEAVGGMSNLGVGLGVMGGIAAGVGPTMAGIATQALDPIMPQPQGQQSFGAPPMLGLKDEEIPPVSPTPKAESVEELEVRIRKLELLKGKIPDEVYNAKMNEILSSI